MWVPWAGETECGGILACGGHSGPGGGTATGTRSTPAQREYRAPHVVRESRAAGDEGLRLSRVAGGFRPVDVDLQGGLYLLALFLLDANLTSHTVTLAEVAQPRDGAVNHDLRLLRNQAGADHFLSVLLAVVQQGDLTGLVRMDVELLDLPLQGQHFEARLATTTPTRRKERGKTDHEQC